MRELHRPEERRRDGVLQAIGEYLVARECSWCGLPLDERAGFDRKHGLAFCRACASLLDERRNREANS